MDESAKSRLCKLLQDITVPENKPSVKCSDFLKEFTDKLSSENKNDVVEVEEVSSVEIQKNPFKVDHQRLEEIERKLKNLNALKIGDLKVENTKRQCQTDSTNELLSEINNELEQNACKDAIITSLRDAIQES